MVPYQLKQISKLKGNYEIDTNWFNEILETLIQNENNSIVSVIQLDFLLELKKHLIQIPTCPKKESNY